MDELVNLDCSQYYQLSDFNEARIGNNLMKLHQNIRSFEKNYDSFSVFLQHFSRKIDVIVITESWFREDNCADIPGYNSFHTFRADRTGGGVSVFTREGMKVNFNSDPSVISETCEACVIDICPALSGDKCVSVIAIYRPPNSSRPIFIEKINEFLSRANNKDTVIVGDFNVDTLDDNDSSDLFDIMFGYGFFPLINIPTRVTDSTAKCIDHIWYNKFDVSLCGSFVVDVSDHYPVFAVIDTPIDSNMTKKTFRDHSNRSLQLLEDMIPDVVDAYWRHNFVDVNHKTEWFVEMLYSIYNRCCPRKTKSMSAKKLSKPWINDYLVTKINEKHTIFKYYKQGNIEFNEYNNFKNRLTKMINSAKKNYYANKFHQYKNNAKATWSTINSVLNRSKKGPAPNVLISGDHEIYNPVDISNLFCNHFSSIAVNLDNSIPASPLDPLYCMPQPKANSCLIIPTTPCEVISIIMKLENKSGDINTIPVFIYKLISRSIAPILCDIFNSSVGSGIFPETLKLAKVVPIYKSKNRKIPSNYRPISILLTVSKIMEKIMKMRVSKFINAGNILYDKQFGFREGYSTSDAVLELVDKCATALDSKLYTIAVFLDLSKAFDTVNRQIMIRKMCSLGFRGVVGEWFDSYLCNRRMYVDVNGEHSVTRTLNIGLPQGSVTSPYLFSLYVNDMHRSSDKLSFLHFADDTTIFLSGDNLTTLYADMNEELEKVNQWLQSNRLSLNTDKTKYMLFTHKNVDHQSFNIKINNSVISHVNHIKFLGITIDRRLNYNEHLSVLSTKLNCVIGVIRKISYDVPAEVLKLLYFSLFYPHLIYCVAVWGGCGKTNVGKINRVNDRICSLFSNIYNCKFVPCRFQQIYDCFLLSIFHIFLTNHSHNPYFSDKLSDLMPTHDHNTRFFTSECITLPLLHKNSSQNQFIYNAIKRWNALPLQIRNIENHRKFVSELKKHLYNH